MAAYFHLETGLVSDSGWLSTPGPGPPGEALANTSAQLVADLARRADITPTAGGSLRRWSIAGYDGRTFDPVDLLACTDKDLTEYLDATAGDAAVLFPGVSARIGAYRLLLVHLEEALLSMTPPTRLAVTAGVLAESHQRTAR